MSVTKPLKIMLGKTWNSDHLAVVHNPPPPSGVEKLSQIS